MHHTHLHYKSSTHCLATIVVGLPEADAAKEGGEGKGWGGKRVGRREGGEERGWGGERVGRKEGGEERG
jgi:hypothetical protein